MALHVYNESVYAWFMKYAQIDDPMNYEDISDRFIHFIKSVKFTNTYKLELVTSFAIDLKIEANKIKKSYKYRKNYSGARFGLFNLKALVYELLNAIKLENSQGKQ